jgi:hypothetical protein
MVGWAFCSVYDKASARKRLELTSEHFEAAMDSFLLRSGIIMATSVYVDAGSTAQTQFLSVSLCIRKPETSDAL